MQTEEEVLGTVDTGPPVEWWHIGVIGELRALCGHMCSEDLGPLDAPLPEGARECPDCLRIYHAAISQ